MHFEEEFLQKEESPSQKKILATWHTHTHIHTHSHRLAHPSMEYSVYIVSLWFGLYPKVNKGLTIWLPYQINQKETLFKVSENYQKCLISVPKKLFVQFFLILQLFQIFEFSRQIVADLHFCIQVLMFGAKIQTFIWKWYFEVLLKTVSLLKIGK